MNTKIGRHLMNLLIKVRSAFDVTLNLFSFVAILIMVFVLISVCLGVFMRYFLQNPLGWVVQTSQYSLVFVTFLAAAWVLRREKHVTMDLLTNCLSPGKKAVLGIITSIVGALVCLIITYYSFLVTLDHFKRNIYDMQVVEVPLGPMFAVMTLGFFTLFIQFLRRVLEFFDERRTLKGEHSG